MDNYIVLTTLSEYLSTNTINNLHMVSKDTKKYIKYIQTECLCNYVCGLNCRCKCNVCNSKICF